MLFKTPLLAALFFALGTLAGESHPYAYSQNVKITPIFKTSTTWAGQPLAYSKTDAPEATMLVAEIPPGKETGRHTHPFQGYTYIISGTLTVVTKERSITVHAGQGFAETVNTPHDGKNLGKEPVKLVVVYTGEKGMPFTVKIPNGS
jgi:quercetin dioxygenase-like cupin family protein